MRQESEKWGKYGTSAGKISGRSPTFETLEERQYLTTISLTSPSSNSGDGTWVTEQREGTTVHVGPAFLYYNTTLNAFPGAQAGDTFYLKVNYYDEGSGRLRVEYDSLTDNFDDTEFHSRSSVVNTQQFVSTYHVLENVQFANGSNGRDFRVNTGGVPISTVELSDQPFPESGLDWVFSPPWESSYDGPSREVDASTLQGKVLAGYQGWFNTPNDAADQGYVHWGQPGDWSIEMWPDAKDYDSTELFAVPGVSTASGEQAYLFSSANASVVQRHFRWMREHDIDGVFVQRFTGSFMFKQPDGSYQGEPQWPVVNARDAAHREGRTWAIEYDIQNGGTEAQRWQRIQQVKDDWEFLTATSGLDMLNDSHYQREDGKPVVAIFGLHVSSGNTYTTAQQTDLINYFQSRGVYVIGAGRHTQTPGQVANAGLHDAYIPWQGYWAGGNSFAPNEAILDGVTDHIPHVFPGFSWTHLQNDNLATSVDREDGEFYWRMISDAANETNAPWYFIGMFDEYDEGTNLIPATDDPPVPDTDPQGDPLTYQVSDPRPNDWWMALTGRAKQALQGKISINDTMPTEAELQNRSNVGGEVVWQVSGNDRLTTVDNPDGQIQTMSFTVDGETFDAIYSADDYLYFAVDDDFLLDETDGRDVTIEVEYFDDSTGQFGVEYDSSTSFFAASDPAPLTGSNLWRTHRFELSDARFDNNQNGGADFRLEKAGGNLFVRRVRVIKESMLTVEADLGASNDVNGLRQVDQSGDGQTAATTVDGRSVSLVTGSPTSLYMYMRVDDDFASNVQAGLNAIVEVVYRDVGTGTLNIQYDSTTSAFEAATPVVLTNSDQWRMARFYLDDAFFGNRQNAAADFRLVGSNIPIDRVRVLHGFSDLVAPELQSLAATNQPSQGSVEITWAVSDEWRTGSMDQWTEQEDARVQFEWTSNSGATWSPIDTIFEQASGTAQSGYDTAAKRSTWSDQFTWDTSNLAAGTYQVRVTPTDGRGNIGASLTTAPFDINQPPALLGDYNYSHEVDGADLTVWSDGYATSVATGTGADGTMNGLVDGGDFLAWQRSFGNSANTSVASLSVSAAEPQEIEALVLESHIVLDASFSHWTDERIGQASEFVTEETAVTVVVPASASLPLLSSIKAVELSERRALHDKVFSEDVGNEETKSGKNSAWDYLSGRSQGLGMSFE